MQSEPTVKGIGDWQRGHNAPVTGKLTPAEAVALNNEAARAPIKRIDPSSQAAAAPPPHHHHRHRRRSRMPTP